MSEQSVFFFFPAITFFIGFVFVCIAIGMGSSMARKKKRCTAVTIGKVADYRLLTHSDSDGTYSRSWHPVFSYFVNGNEYKKTSAFGRSKKKFRQCESVTVYYDPAKPKYFYVQEEDNSIFVKIFGAVGALLLLICVLSLVCFALFF